MKNQVDKIYSEIDRHIEKRNSVDTTVCNKETEYLDLDDLDSAVEVAEYTLSQYAGAEHSGRDGSSSFFD